MLIACTHALATMNTNPNSSDCHEHRLLDSMKGGLSG